MKQVCVCVATTNLSCAKSSARMEKNMNVALLNQYAGILSNGISSNSLNAIKGIGSSTSGTGLEGISEIMGSASTESTDSTSVDFASILNKCVGQAQTDTSAVEWVDQLKDVVAEMNADSSTNSIAKDLYDYFQKQAYASGGINSVLKLGSVEHS